MFHPRNSIRWLGYWFTLALDPSANPSRRSALAQGAFALIRRLSPPGAGLAPYLCHRLATSLVALILLYGADLFTPRVGTTTRLNTFWHKVQRWTTNPFSPTPTGILSVESCLLPVSPDHPSAKASGAQDRLLPPQCEPSDRSPPPLFPLALSASSTQLLTGPN